MRTTKWIAIWSLAVTGLAAIGLAQTTAAVSYKIEQTRLGPWDTEMLDFAFSSDGRHFAYLSSHECQKSGSRCVIVDGNLLEEAPDIREGTLALSPDGAHVAYAAKRDKQWTVVVDGKPGAVYDDIEIGSPLFSPDSKHVAFVAKVGGRHVMVVDGQAGAEYDEILNPAREARVKADRGEMPGGVVAGGVAGSLMMGALARSWHAAVEPVSYDLFRQENPPTPIFSPDGRRMAYVARNGKRWSVVVDGQAGAEFEHLSGPPVFSPDSKHLAYTVRQDKRERLVVDGKEVGADYDASGDPVFSPDGKRLAYLAERGKQGFVVVDDQPCPGLGGYVGGPVAFSSDGKHLIYLAGKKKQAFFMADGQTVAEFIGFGPLLFSPAISPDGKRLAYLDDASPREGSKKQVVADGQVVTVNYNFGAPIFSPDSRHLAFISGTAFGATSVMVDGKAVEGPQYVVNGSLAFDPDGALEFLSPRKDSGVFGLYRIKYIPTP